jgi:prephenate dehydrogenase
MGVIDKGGREINIVKDADLLILATPVNTILKIAERVSKIIKKDCIVIDVGSTKHEIVSRLDELFSHYLGTHPLAGSQKSGVAYARADIFKDSVCILTPTSRTKGEVVKKIRKLWEGVGSKVILVPTRKHDKIVSFVSHLPHLLAFGLMDLIPRDYLKFAASGLKDTTRIASSEPHLWVDIFITNRLELLKALGRFNKRLSKIEEFLHQKNKRGLYRFLTNAKQKRDTIV